MEFRARKRVRRFVTVAVTAVALVAAGLAWPAPTMPASGTSNAQATADDTDGVTSVSVMSVFTSPDGTQVVDLQAVPLAGRTLQQALDEEARRPHVVSVAPNHPVHQQFRPSDPLYPQQEHLGPSAGSRYGIDAERAWDVTRGDPSVVVAVIDSGVQRHADLVDNLLPGYDFVNRDSDARDPGDGGWPQCPTAPSSWHGTHVAGVVAAAQNSIGVSGVAPRVKILPVRAMGACGRGNNVDILNGVLWAAGVPLRGVPTNPNPADIINLSLGGLGRCTTQEQQVFNLVTNQGVLVVAAAGNQSQPASYSAPANCWNTFSVGASATTGRRTRYSNFGSGVDVYAPGGDGPPGGILSTVDAGWQDPEGDAYQRQSGTSMAAPVVAGIAALMKSVNPNLTPLDLARGLRASASRCNGDTCPTGIVNARLAVDFARGVTGGGSGDDGDAVEPTLPPPPPPPDPQILPDPNDPDPSIAQSRYGGTSAFDVAAATARHVAMRRGFAGNNADMVAVLANATSFADGLTASVVAGHHDAVILYVERDSIPRATELALAELRISRVVIVGGPAVVSETVVAALNAMGVTVMSRLWGDNRYLTADAVAREVMDAKAYLFIASGRNFADAVAAGPALYVGRYPMVLADRTGLSPATQQVVIDWYRSRPTGQVIIL